MGGTAEMGSPRLPPPRPCWGLPKPKASAHRPPPPPSGAHPVGGRGTGPHSRGVGGLSQSGIRPAQAREGVRTGSCACHTRRRGLSLRGLQLWAQLWRCQVGEPAWGLHTAARGHPAAAQSQAQWPPQPGRGDRSWGPGQGGRWVCFQVHHALVFMILLLSRVEGLN